MKKTHRVLQQIPFCGGTTPRENIGQSRKRGSTCLIVKNFTSVFFNFFNLLSVLNKCRTPALLLAPGPMECGLRNPARAGRQQRYFALHPPWSPWHFLCCLATVSRQTERRARGAI